MFGGGSFVTPQKPGAQPQFGFGQQATQLAFGQQPPVSQPSFGFGQQPATTQSAMLGQSTAQPSGMFGQTVATSQPAMFGQTAAQPSNKFGQNTTQPALFGQTSVQPFGQTTTQPGLFGQQQPKAGMFGQPSAQNALFGAQAAAQPKTLFGQPPVQQAQMFGQQSVQAPQQQQDPIQQIAAAWNPASPQCQFKHYFYNMVHPNQVHLYAPPPGHDQALYAQAQRDNPDPSCMVPVLALGFPDLKKRIEMQSDQSALHLEKLNEISERIDTLVRQHHDATKIKLNALKLTQKKLKHRIYTLMASITRLTHAGYALHPAEETLMCRLESMHRDLEKPQVFRGRLAEIFALVVQISEGGKERVGMVDPEGLKNVYEALRGTGDGLKTLTEWIRSDAEVLDSISKGYN